MSEFPTLNEGIFKSLLQNNKSIGYVCPHISKVKNLRQNNIETSKMDYVIGKMNIKSEILSPIISNNDNPLLQKRI